MNAKLLSLLVGAAVSVVSVTANGEAEAYNCKTYAVETPVSDTAATLKFVRQWNETGYDPGSATFSGAWMDGGVTNLSEQLGCCWLSVTLEKGKDYVIRVPSVTGRYLVATPKDSTTLTKFSQVILDGLAYYYIRAKDWRPVDADTVDFYLNYNGGRGSVDQEFEFLFKNASIDDVLSQYPGTRACPIVLDVTADGSQVIADAVETMYTRYSTSYLVSLKAGESYTFTAVSPSIDYTLQFWLKDADEWDKIPGTYSNNPEGGTLSVSVTKDYDLTLLVVPYYDWWDEPGGENPGGGTISWHLASSPEPQPTYAGTFEGSLTDVNDGTKTVSFSVVAKRIDNGQTNFTATVKDGSETISLYDDGTGCAVTGTTTIAGKSWDQMLALSLNNATQLSVDGSLHLKKGSGAEEYFFQGTLGGTIVAWDDCFMKYDPQVSSALEMGITSGAFAGEPAGSATLVKVHAWGSSKNVAISSVNGATFAENGDPTTLTAEAYLLNCAATDAAVEAAAAEFVIESYDPSTGTIVMRGGASGGDSYGNGTVQVRTSKTPGGTYDAADKGETSVLFSKAYLVK